MSQGPVPGWLLAAALVLLVVIAVGGSRLGRLAIERRLVSSAGRAIIQLALVSAVIAVVLAEPAATAVFVGFMFATATFTAAGRVEARPDWLWIATAMAGGVLPVLAVIFGLGAAPLTGQAIIPITGIIIGGSMTAHTLTARRAFDALRSDRGQVDAGLALGMPRHAAITNVIERHAPEALTPILDQTRTVGLVTLPGAFVGVLLGWGVGGRGGSGPGLGSRWPSRRRNAGSGHITTVDCRRSHNATRSALHSPPAIAPRRGA